MITGNKGKGKKKGEKGRKGEKRREKEKDWKSFTYFSKFLSVYEQLFYHILSFRGKTKLIQ